MTDEDKKLAFEKTRYDYCKNLFEKEVSRIDMLEKKAQTYLTLTALFIGAIFLNMKSFSEFLSTVQTSSRLSPKVFYIPLILLCICLLGSLFSVLQSIRIRNWRGGYPVDITSTLFSPNSKYIHGSNEAEFFAMLALEYILAWDYNHNINNSKAKWTQISAHLIIYAALSIFILIGMIIYERIMF
jgi:hypothetical protein